MIYLKCSGMKTTKKEASKELDAVQKATPLIPSPSHSFFWYLFLRYMFSQDDFCVICKIFKFAESITLIGNEGGFSLLRHISPYFARKS